MTDPFELPETDLLEGGRSGGGVAISIPSSSISTLLTLDAQSDSLIASAKSGSAFSSAGDNPEGSDDHGFCFCLPLALTDSGAEAGGFAGVTKLFERDGPASGTITSGSDSSKSFGVGSGVDKTLIAFLTPSSPNSAEYASTRFVYGCILP